MASITHVLTSAPVNLVTELSLTEGKQYHGQFRATTEEPELTRDSSMMRAVEQAASPTPDDDNANVIPHNGWITFEPVSGMGIWVWLNESNGKLIVNTDLRGS